MQDDLKYEQEIFDRVVNHLRTQQAVSRSAEVGPMGKPGCAYRGDNGLKCAVGCLISDNAYSPFIEGEPVSAGMVRRALLRSGVRMTTRLEAVLSQLQAVHDTEQIRHWEGWFKDIARRYGLQYKEEK